MKKSPIRLIIALLVAGTIAITQMSCNENSLIDAKVAPNLNNINISAIDTFTIIAKTVYDDSVITSLDITGLPIYHALGTINADPFFGKTNAGIYVQVVPMSASPSATIFSNLDSAVLILPYAGYTYGDSSTLANNQTVNVYQISNNISKDSTYYSFSNTGYIPTRLWGTATMNINNLHDSVFMFGMNRRPLLRIPLNNNFITDLSNSSINYGIDYPTFLGNFRGLYIGPDTNQTAQSLPYFQLDGADTFSQANVLVFYRNSPTDTERVFQYPFSTTYCGHYNNITRNYTGKPAAAHIPGVLQSDSLLLVQNQPGAALDVRIPYLKNLQGSIPKMIINKAELIITQINSSPYTSPIYSTPTKLFAVGVNSDGSKYELADRYPLSSTSSLAFLGGYLQTITVNGLPTQQYTINLPREAINTIIQQRELHLHINATQDYPGATRLIAGGSTFSDPGFRIKFRIVYSKQ